MQSIDARAFRNALGQFATGVTIVTACGDSGERVGATVSSFNSVSLDPPLVLWSLDKGAYSRAAFESSTHFAVHVLTLDQAELARRFAQRGTDKFACVECRPGLGDIPLIGECAACFECETRHRYDGGDHVIFVGEVKRFTHVAGKPLLFHGGAFAEVRQLARAGELDGGVDEVSGRFGPDFICYLVARSHFQMYRPLRAELERVGVDETEYFVLSMLCIRERMPFQALVTVLEHTGYAPTQGKILQMASKGYVEVGRSGGDLLIAIAEPGRRAYVLLLAVDGRIARQALDGFAPHEIAEFAGYLKRLIGNTGTSPDVWTYPGIAQ
jgi:3-hydroxy-9,10-secoandrosta-1,3,5(10)-triene-9,17-dione monooxygenase reductase component